MCQNYQQNQTNVFVVLLMNRNEFAEVYIISFSWITVSSFITAAGIALYGLVVFSFSAIAVTHFPNVSKHFFENC